MHEPLQEPTDRKTDQQSEVPDESQRRLYWLRLLSRLLRKQGVLQRHGKSGWRLRWREWGEDGIRHQRSHTIPPHEVNMVRDIVAAIRVVRSREKEEQAQQKQLALQMYERYRECRKKLCEFMPGGRESKSRALRMYDALASISPAKAEMSCMGARMLSLPLRRGRPRKRIPG